ncbi:MAG: PilZ domain-containing protein [Gammaproteobacteria bacterium]|nr:PilZ domain-containing protein [Gammaproteobacteria bacterium]
MAPRDYEEKRDFIRMQLDCPIQCNDMRTGERFIGRARDLSGKGLCLELPRELPPGTLLEVRIEPARTVVAPLHALVEVMRCEPDSSDRQFRVGTSIREFKS